MGTEVLEGKTFVTAQATCSVSWHVLHGKTPVEDIFLCRVRDDASPGVSWRWTLGLRSGSSGGTWGTITPYAEHRVCFSCRLDLKDSPDRAVRALIKVQVRQEDGRGNFGQEYIKEQEWATYSIDSHEPGDAGFTGSSREFYVGWEQADALLAWDRQVYLLITASVSWTAADTPSSLATTFIAQKLQALQLSTTHTDVVFVVGVHEIPAHSQILAAASEVFGCMFQHETKDKLTGRVRVEDATPGPFKQMLRSAYTGQEPQWTSDDDLLELAYLAHKYVLDRLLAQCARRMLDSLRVDNACKMLKFAHKLDMQDVKDRIASFIHQNKKVLQTEEWNELRTTGDPKLSGETVAMLLRNSTSYTNPPRSSDVYIWRSRDTYEGSFTVRRSALKCGTIHEAYTFRDSAKPDVVLWKFSLSLKSAEESTSNQPQLNHASILYKLENCGDLARAWIGVDVIQESDVADVGSNDLTWKRYSTVAVHQRGGSALRELLSAAEVLPSLKKLRIRVTILHYKDKIERTEAIRVPDYLEYVTSKFQALQESGTLSDVVFEVGNAEIPAHSQVLVAISQEFSPMFREAQTGRVSVRVENATAAVVRQMLRSAYTGQEPQWTGDDDLLQLAGLAHKYKLDRLLAQCARRMKDSLAVDNACKVLKAASELSLNNVRETAAWFIAGHPDVLQSKEWDELARKDPSIAFEAYSSMLKCLF